MDMPKASEADKDFFRAVMPDSPDVEVKPMFGNLGAFVNGNMFAGLFGHSVGVKLDDDARARLELVEGSGPFGPGDRPMGGYISLPESFDDREAAEWVALAHAHVAMLAPKVKKPKK
jgi:TfoX/Sxy family transcriptional regulator of competence genes